MSSYTSWANDEDSRLAGWIFLIGAIVGIVAVLLDAVVALGWYLGISFPGAGAGFIWFMVNALAVILLGFGGGRLWWLRRERLRNGGPRYFMPNL